MKTPKAATMEAIKNNISNVDVATATSQGRAIGSVQSGQRLGKTSMMILLHNYL